MSFGASVLAEYTRDGYAVARGLFSPEECAELREHFMRLRAAGSYTGDSVGVPIDGDRPDPLQKYPRMIHMHRWDEPARRWMLDPRLRVGLAQLLGVDPYAVQTMLYFKPPGARGQALHQDQFYLRVQPGTCMAAWMALDRADEENGCMLVVPGSQDLPVLCTQRADTQVSFTDTTVPVPEGMAVVPVVMEPGDVLFFNGSLIHGSGPNRSADRFRRALIGHYIQADALTVAKFFNPVLDMAGRELVLSESEKGGPCGVWVDRDGQQVVEMVDKGDRAAAAPAEMLP
jgi:phytanoyl-CoA hydroxylase